MWALPLQLDREQRCKDHSLEIDQARSVDVGTYFYMWALLLKLEREHRCKDHFLEIDQARSVDVLISTCGNCFLSWRGSRGARITPWRLIRLGQ
jgi:hypothetical protein